MNMDLNDLRSLVTVILFASFLGIVVWAYARKNQQSFNDAAQLPFTGEQAGQSNIGGTNE
jgi:cytochrome c oxidase cbb3-type subunit IV